MDEYNREEYDKYLNQIKEETESLKETRKALEQQKKETKKSKKMKIRKFKVHLADAALVAALATGVGLAFAKPWEYKQEKDIKKLQVEADIHGGAKVESEDKYLYNINEHNHCLIEGEGSVEERIQEFCVEDDIPEEISDLIIERYELNLNGEYSEARDIDALKEYKKIKKEGKTLK